MNKGKSFLQGKFSFFTIFWLGFLVLGIGLISWALVNIMTQVIHSANDYSSSTASPITFAEKQVRSTEVDINNYRRDTTAPTEPDHTSEIPNPEKILYPIYPAEGDCIGSLSIPVLKQKLPIIQGTGEDELKKGV